MMYWWLIPVVTSCSLMLTAVFRNYALARSIVDIPNARSSHLISTPRGGGVAIVITFLLVLSFLSWVELVDLPLLIAIGGAGGVVAIIGFMDDYNHIAVPWRLSAHFCAAVWSLFWLGGFPPIITFGFVVDPGWLGLILGAFYLVWMLNLYNFMDGIDGIASIEAISVCSGACLLYWLMGLEHLIWAPGMLALAVSGFLFWNFPKARIFMGDAGSGFLGLVFGIISIQAAWVAPQLLWAWLILLGVFIVDATFTLIRRLVRGDKFYEAHRSHVYQIASRRYGTHIAVSLAVGMINLVWLLPIALCVTYFRLDGVLALVVAYTPLLILAIKFQSDGIEKEPICQ
ncbi:glycosyltransferase family 4 protein [Pseudomonas sp. p50]|uniref:MraY family glycosyltransferase n=1 Tax=Pseudomonas sp. p50(2008) TaxID=2816832 RepID=UPI00188AC0AF|nr:glycosyltransferase family 4 protein [Pseudomonas sp. p50(2008)]MBF4555092.1 glycosyltransferase family 4 protein [Pseudomonas sp. p50(2008)]